MEPLYPNVGDALHVLHIRKSNRDQREATPRWYSEAVSSWESWLPFSERSPGVPPARERVPECVYITQPDHALHQLIGRLHRHLTLLAQRKTQMLNQTQVKRIRPFNGPIEASRFFSLPMRDNMRMDGVRLAESSCDRNW